VEIGNECDGESEGWAIVEVKRMKSCAAGLLTGRYSLLCTVRQHPKTVLRGVFTRSIRCRGQALQAQALGTLCFKRFRTNAPLPRDPRPRKQTLSLSHSGSPVFFTRDRSTVKFVQSSCAWQLCGRNVFGTASGLESGKLHLSRGKIARDLVRNIGNW
jgi:hypothetical protein